MVHTAAISLLGHDDLEFLWRKSLRQATRNEETRCIVQNLPARQIDFDKLECGTRKRGSGDASFPFVGVPRPHLAVLVGRAGLIEKIVYKGAVSSRIKI